MSVRVRGGVVVMRGSSGVPFGWMEVAEDRLRMKSTFGAVSSFPRAEVDYVAVRGRLMNVTVMVIGPGDVRQSDWFRPSLRGRGRLLDALAIAGWRTKRVGPKLSWW